MSAQFEAGCGDYLFYNAPEITQILAFRNPWERHMRPAMFMIAPKNQTQNDRFLDGVELRHQFGKRDRRQNRPLPLFELRLESMCNCAEPAFASQEFSVIHSSDGATAFSVGRVRWSRTGLSCTEPQGVSAIRLRSLARVMSRSPEALAFGARRHFIPASLSLPLCGCLLNRSRDCSRSRVPPLPASALC
jgi:hypothetical protein